MKRKSGATKRFSGAFTKKLKTKKYYLKKILNTTKGIKNYFQKDSLSMDLFFSYSFKSKKNRKRILTRYELHLIGSDFVTM